MSPHQHMYFMKSGSWNLWLCVDMFRIRFWFQLTNKIIVCSSMEKYGIAYLPYSICLLVLLWGHLSVLFTTCCLQLNWWWSICCVLVLSVDYLSICRYNGSLPNGDRGRRKSRFALFKRPKSNGVKPSTVHVACTPQAAKVHTPST